MFSDDKFEKPIHKTSLAGGDTAPNAKYHHLDDNPCYTGDSITLVLASYNYSLGTNPNEEHYIEPTDFWYHEFRIDEYLLQGELVKPRIACLFCSREITLNSGCYMFCQTREQYDRNITLVACSDACFVALSNIGKSTCQLCHREYLRDLYDNDICMLCK